MCAGSPGSGTFPIVRCDIPPGMRGIPAGSRAIAARTAGLRSRLPNIGPETCVIATPARPIRPAKRIIPTSERIIPTSERIIPISARLICPAARIISIPERAICPAERIATISEPTIGSVVYIIRPTERLTRPTGRIIGSPERMTPSAGRMSRSAGEMMRSDLAQAGNVAPMSQRRGGMSLVRGPIGSAGFAIDRRPAARARRLDADAPFLDQVLENPVETAAIRLIAERRAHVAAREAVGEARQRCTDVLLQIAGAAAPG